ncbi:hypothetical protein QBC34DRAFT_493480, partial [Podospora aff. communis PSN243]
MAETMAEKAQVHALARIRRLRIQLYAKGRSDIAQDHGQFAIFLSSRLGELDSTWTIAGDPPGASESWPPERDVFLVQACATYANGSGGGADDALNLKSRILPALNDWPEGDNENSTTSLFMRMIQDPDGRLIACELLDGAAAIKQSSDVPTGVSSYWDAIAETAWTGVGVTVLMHSLYSLIGETNDRRRVEIGDDHLDGLIQGILAGINRSSTPLWKTAQVETIVEQRRRLAATLGLLQRRFDEANSWMSLEHGLELSRAEALRFVQLVATLSSALEDTMAVLQNLAPLHENYYSAQKRTVSKTVAVLGGTAAVAVALLWLTPAGWAVSVLGTAAKAVAAHSTASALTAASGTMVAALCGNQASTCKAQ